MSTEEDCRAYHWLKPLTGNRVPAHWIVVDGLFQATTCDEDTRDALHLLERLAIRRLRRDRDRWRDEVTTLWTAGPGALEALWRACWAGETTWLVGWGMSRILEGLDFWREMERGEFVAGPAAAELGERQAGDDSHVVAPARLLVLSDPPFIVAGQWRGKAVMIVDSRNYWHAHPDQFETEEGRLEHEDAAGPPGVLRPHRTLVNRCTALALQLSRTIDRWIDTVGASWAPTVAGLAWSDFRRNHLPEKHVLIHGDTMALRLERLSYYGGECSPFYVGRVMSEQCATVPPPRSWDGPLEIVHGDLCEIDVSSLYPSRLAGEPQPCVLLGHRIGERGLERVCNRQTRWGVAFVRVSTNRPIFPVRVNRETLVPVLSLTDFDLGWDQRSPHRVIYPVGEFDTVLCGEELMHALQCGHLIRCYQWVEYEARPLGQTFVQTHWNARLDCRMAGLDVEESFHKSMLNALIGKFGQQVSTWQTEPGEIPPCQWGSYVSYNHATGEIGQWRAVNGLAQRSVPAGEADNSCPAIAASVTASARCHMRFLRGLLPPRTIYYQDTDSLHLPLEECGRVMDVAREEFPILGGLRVKGLSQSATYLGKRCYWFGGRWVVAGVPRGTVLDPDDEWSMRATDGAATVIQRGPGKGVRSRTIRRVPKVIDCGGVIGPDGWVVPYEISPRK